MYRSIENRRHSFSTAFIFYRSSSAWSTATRFSRELRITLPWFPSLSQFRQSPAVASEQMSSLWLSCLSLSSCFSCFFFQNWTLFYHFQCLPSIFFTRASSSLLDLSLSLSLQKSMVPLFLPLAASPWWSEINTYFSFLVLSIWSWWSAPFCEKHSTSHLLLIIFCCVCCFLFSSFLSSAMTFMSFFPLLFLLVLAAFTWWSHSGVYTAHWNTIMCLR